MTTLVLSPEEVRALLPMRTCMELVAEALRAHARGETDNPLRRGMLVSGSRNLIGMMPGALRSPPALGLKVVGVFPGNHGTAYDSHQGVVLLFDPEHGTPVGIFDASEITAIRTGAASGVATQLLARQDAGDLAILGTGVEARTHLEAMAEARTLRSVRVFSRDPERRAAFAQRASQTLGLEVEAAPSAEAAVRGADLVCTTTSSRTPVVRGEWLSPGCHVNAVGACMPKARELDTAAVVRSRLFTDCRESAVNESGDYLIPLAEGALDEAHLLGEIGELLEGTLAGRESDEDITVFDSLGIAVEDLIVAHHLLERGRAEGVGTEVSLGGRAG
jgi:ornithine cyclodeaminase